MVTAVLVTREESWPADIQWPECVGDTPITEVLIETNCVGVHRRMDLVRQAKNEIVYVQDDDVKTDVETLWDRAQKNLDGLTYAITPGFKEMYDGLCGSRACLIGFGAFFPKSFADPFRWATYTDRFGEELRELDRLMAWFAESRQPVYCGIAPRQRKRAMCRERGHYDNRTRVLSNLRSL